MNNTAMQTLDNMVFEKEAFPKLDKESLNRISDFFYNKQVHKEGLKEIKQMRKNYETALKNCKPHSKETAIALRTNNTGKSKVYEQIVDTTKKHPVATGLSATAVVAIPATAAIFKKKKKNEEDTEKAASELLNDMCLEKEAAIGATIAQFGKNLMNSGTVQKAVNAGKNFLNSGAGQSLMSSAKQGATFGAIQGAMNPGTDENGKQKSRIGSMVKGALGGAAINTGFNAVGAYGPKAFNAVKNAWPTKTASELLDEMVLEKEAEWDPGTVMGGIMGGISGFASAQKKGLNWKDTALKTGMRTATGAIIGGTVNGVANYLNNKSQAMPNQQEYYGKQNLNG